MSLVTSRVKGTKSHNLHFCTRNIETTDES